MRLRSLVVAAATALSLTAGIGLPAHADDPADRKKQADAAVQALQGDLDETSVRLRSAGAALTTAQAKLPAAQRGVDAATRRLTEARQHDAALVASLAVARREEARSVRSLAQVRTRVTGSRRQIGMLAHYAYQHGQGSQVAVALAAQTPREFADRVQLLDTASRNENATLNRLAEDRADAAAEQIRLTAKRAQIAGLREQAKAQVVTVAALDLKARGAKAGVEQLIADAADAQAVIEAEKAAEERQLAAARAESERLNQLLVARAAAARKAAALAAAAAAAADAAREAAARSDAVPLSAGGDTTPSAPPDQVAPPSRPDPGTSSYAGGSGVLSRPVSAPISSPYGMRVHPVTGVYKLHDGTDFAASCGTPVHAAAAGTVVWTRLMSGYGNQLAIDHGILAGHAISTSYSHLSAFVASVGQHVERGDVIAYSGGAAGMYGAGSSTGCHVHFMVMDQAAPINQNGFPTVQPMSWL